MDFNALIKRVTNIIIKPNEEWQVIESENKSKTEVLTGYALPFILAIALSSTTGSLLFSFGYFSIPYIIATTIVSLFVPLAGIYLSAYIINALAPSFGSTPNIDNAFKLVIYSYTASFLISIVTSLVPFLFFISIAGVYSLYVFWVGFVPMMKTPENKKAGYAIVSILIMIGVYTNLAMISGFVIASFFLSSAAHLLF